MGTNELLAKLIEAWGFNPDEVVGNRTIFDIVESHVQAAFDEIEEAKDNES